MPLPILLRNIMLLRTLISSPGFSNYLNATKIPSSKSTTTKLTEKNIVKGATQRTGVKKPIAKSIANKETITKAAKKTSF